MLSSFGPNMQLARELHEAGEADAVVRYLARCSEFWDDERLDGLAAQIRDGTAPDWSSFWR